MAELFTNLASTTISGDHAAAATAITVASGAVFPSPTGSDFFRVVAFKKSTAQKEIMTCSSRASNVLTVTRAQESTAALDLLDGDIIELRPTAAFFSALAQKIDIQDGSTVYATTSGTNTYAATLTPAPAAIGAGHHASLKIGVTNDSTTCTLNVNSTGAVAIKKVAGGSLVDPAVGDIIADMIAEFRHNGTVWILLNSPEVLGVLNAPAGTKMIFRTAAPTGWTRDTGLTNDSVLRFVTGSVGSGGSWTISGLSMAHTHVVSGITGGAVGAETEATGGSPGINTVSASHTHNVSFSSQAASTSAVSSTGAWRPLYVDILIATKD